MRLVLPLLRLDLPLLRIYCQVRDHESLGASFCVNEGLPVTPFFPLDPQVKRDALLMLV